jgi:hypothetical protein
MAVNALPLPAGDDEAARHFVDMWRELYLGAVDVESRAEAARCVLARLRKGTLGERARPALIEAVCTALLRDDVDESVLQSLVALLTLLAPALPGSSLVYRRILAIAMGEASWRTVHLRSLACACLCALTGSYVASLVGDGAVSAVEETLSHLGRVLSPAQSTAVRRSILRASESLVASLEARLSAREWKSVAVKWLAMTVAFVDDADDAVMAAAAALVSRICGRRAALSATNCLDAAFRLLESEPQATICQILCSLADRVLADPVGVEASDENDEEASEPSSTHQVFAADDSGGWTSEPQLFLRRLMNFAEIAQVGDQLRAHVSALHSGDPNFAT